MNLEIGKRLRELRTARGLTQKGLASRISGGLDYTYIGKIERGEQMPSLKILIKLGEALEVPVGSFFREEGGAAGAMPCPELRPLFSQEKGGELARALKLLHPDDLPLVAEIVKVLNRHRIAGGVSGNTAVPLPRAAEEEEPYGENSPE